MRSCLSTVVLLLLVAARTAAQDDGELRLGLHARLECGGATLQRIDDELMFVWDDASPDPLLPPGPFAAGWKAQLLVRDEATYRWHAYLEGSVTVRLDGQTVLAARRSQPGWVSGPPAPLDSGFKALTVEYHRTGDSGRLQLFWASDRFPLEPLPGHLLFQPDDLASAVSAELQQLDHGRRLFAAYRCGACHRDAAAVAPDPAPSLDHIGSGTSESWLRAHLQDAGGDPDRRMPAFGCSEREARALLAYLAAESRPAELLAATPIRPNPPQPLPDGSILLHTLGCLACHRVGELGGGALFGGPDLTHVGARRSQDWLYTQLTDPARVNPHSRMPQFDLSDVERAQLAGALAAMGQDGRNADEVGAPAPRQAREEALVEGRRLYETAQCAACHPRTATSDFVPQAPRLDRTMENWDRTCLSETADPAHHRPAYPQADLDALRAYVAALAGRGGAVSPVGPLLRGQFVLEQRNCLGCHERGAATGIAPTAAHVASTVRPLTGLSQALIPPNLTAVGDKLLDEPLAKAVRGEQPRRLPWLRVRMPKFAHASDDQAALVAFLIGRDRIAPGAPDSRFPPLPADSQTLLAGRLLVGPQGFSCIACHELDGYVPPNVAIATHGSDLMRLAERMRPEFFLRWTRSPLRIVPGFEMPSYERPAPGVLDGSVDAQLAALWHALNDPQFTAPTDPASVEQLLVLNPGERPMLIRDVFSVSPACGGGYVPRALALGFDNGHSVLVDLATARVREWTLGEFARQRTQGKSWYWDMAGAPLLRGAQSGDSLWLEPPGDAATAIRPSSPDGRPLTLRSYAHEGNAVRVEYEVRFEAPCGRVAARVQEIWQPFAESGRQGLSRTLTVTGLASGVLLCAVPPPDATGTDTSVTAHDGSIASRRLPDGSPAFPFAREPQSGAQRLTLIYASSLRAPPGRPLAVPAPTAPPEPVTTVPGFIGERLRLPASIMPTSIAWRPDGALVFTSLKGHVYLVRDTDGDGVEDALSMFEQGLAAPFGVLPDGDDLLVAHKPELLRLRDTDGDGRCDERIVVADGWGYTHDYHDWTAGPVRDAQGNLFLALSSDYSQPDRDPATTRWRGKVLRLDPHGGLAPIADELRFPMGIALDADGRLFVSDQQGVQNTFNEINLIVPGGRYGVPALADPPAAGDEWSATLQIPHPWTRSVNGVLFVPQRRERSAEGDPPAPSHLDVFAGHGIGCEYNGRFLVRFTLQDVAGHWQGAVYEFSATRWQDDTDAFLGPICAAVSPSGALYVGSIHDSGWLGGRNTGEIVRLSPRDELPNGIREVTAVPGGFRIEFLHPVDPVRAADASSYAISGSTRVWQGSYATPDSGRHAPDITAVELSDDARSVRLRIAGLRPRHVYEITCRNVGVRGVPLRPATAHYTLTRLPD